MTFELRTTIISYFREHPDASSPAIAKAVGASPWTVDRALWSAGIKRKRGSKFVALPDVIAMYKNGMTLTDIAKRTGVAVTTVGSRIRAAGAMRSKAVAAEQRTSAQVSRFWTFCNLSPDKAWILGLIYGDGHLYTAGGGFCVTTSDFDLIDKISTIFGGRLTYNDQGSYRTIRINSSRIFRELRDLFGLTPNKTRSLKFPSLNSALLPHFIRGLLDSDGSWHVHKKGYLMFGYTSVCREFLESLRSAMIASCGVSSARSISGHNLAYGHNDSVRIGHWMYDGATSHMRSERKFQIWNGSKDAAISQYRISAHRMSSR